MARRKPKPREITVRAYNVGFGDCFLLTFHYAGDERDRHVLIDFGSTAKPKGAKSGHMTAIAKSIAAECGGKLDAIVATHRHRDHISGFATRKDGKGPGDVIRELDPEVVIQPWTEDPAAAPDARKSTRVSSGARAFVGALHNMHGVAKAVYSEVKPIDELYRAAGRGPIPAGTAKPAISRAMAGRLAFMGENNLANLAAVKNLMTMGRRKRSDGRPRGVFVHYGSEHGLEEVLPGVEVKVLGPPNLEQSETIKSQRHEDEGEFWHLQARAGKLVTQQRGDLFPDAPTLPAEELPRASRWLVQRMRKMRGEQLLEIVRILDKALNNTSVILHFKVGKERLLFPGDAQIENWLYALEGPDKKKTHRLLKKVTFYKVGHHGSLNATPKSLWKLFERRTDDPEDAKRLNTVVSTQRGKHGNSRRGTEVPRKKLIEALVGESNCASTEFKPFDETAEKKTDMNPHKWEKVDKLFWRTTLKP